MSWSAVLGYRIHTYVAAELAYMDFSSADVTETFEVPGPFGPPDLTITHSTRVNVRGPAISVLGILPLGAGWEVFLRGGVLFADRENEWRSPSGEDTTFGSEEWLAGAGFQWTFGRRWGLRLEYQRIDSIKGNFRMGEIELDRMTLSGTFAL